MIDPAGTHLGPLAKAIAKFGRRVLEVGCGWYSTPVIHCMSEYALSVENNRTWYDELQSFNPSRILFAQDLVTKVAELATQNVFDVVFLDAYEGADRVACARLFLDLPCCIVGHDTERSYWQPILESARFQRHFKTLSPYTSWFSNVLTSI